MCQNAAWMHHVDSQTDLRAVGESIGMETPLQVLVVLVKKGVADFEARLLPAPADVTTYGDEMLSKMLEIISSSTTHMPMSEKKSREPLTDCSDPQC